MRPQSPLGAWIMTAILACLLLPAVAAAEMMIPVTVRITELWQLDHGQDPGVFGIGQSVADFYAEVTINGTTLDNFDQRCDNPPASSGCVGAAHCARSDHSLRRCCAALPVEARRVPPYRILNAAGMRRRRENVSVNGE